MTTRPIDEKGLEAARSEYAELLDREISEQAMQRIIRAYFSATNTDQTSVQKTHESPDGDQAGELERFAANKTYGAFQSHAGEFVRFDQASSLLAAKDAEIERLRGERLAAEMEMAKARRHAQEVQGTADLWSMFTYEAPGMLPKLWSMVKHWRRKAKAAEARLREAEEALRSFAEYLDEHPFDLDNKGNALPDDTKPGWTYLTAGEFRAARALLKGSTHE